MVWGKQKQHTSRSMVWGKTEIKSGSSTEDILTDCVKKNKWNRNQITS